MKQRKNIALFIGMVETDFSHDIYEGALLAAKEMDANLFVMPGGILNANYADSGFDVYRRQYNILYSYAGLCSFDAIIVEYGTITSLLDYDKKLEFVKQLGDVPAILIAGDIEGYSCISIDNRTGIQDAVTHLIEHHNCRKIGFVTGPKTNQDACERLQAYEETMEQYGLEVKDSMILYSDFSEFCDDVVKDFILRNPGIEAIAFANDQMALSGYRAMEQLGLKPGEDILVTGFDDSPLAMMMEPHLTSVKVEPKDMGYHAVIQAMKAMNGEKIHYKVKPRLMVRESCGCNELRGIEDAVDKLISKMPEGKFEELAKDMVDTCTNEHLDNTERIQVVDDIKQYLEYLYRVIQPDGTAHVGEDEFFRVYRVYMQICQRGSISLKDFLTMDQIIYNYLRGVLKSESDRLCILEWITLLRKELADVVSSKRIISVSETRVYEWIMSNIASEMIYYTDEEESSYHFVVKKLKKVGFASSCILTFKNKVWRSENGQCNIPERIIVKGYHSLEGIYAGEDIEVNISDIFGSDYIPKMRQINMLVIPLFANNYQYGLMMLESGIEHARYAMQIACQLSTAVEVFEIINNQNQIKMKLEESLAKSVESNRLLDEMSRMDPLTGVMNRRGFLDCVKKIMETEGNYGKKAIAIYADMDGLKTINDEFGHDEGDYSLKLIAKALSNSFRKSDVVARMGGDEFAAFAIVNRDDFPELIKARIKSALDELNDDNDKPYYVGVSVGTTEFMIRENTDVEQLLTRADEKLYLEKKKKDKILYKNQRQ